MIKSNNCWKKNRFDFAHFIIFLSGRATMMSPLFSSLFFFVFFFMATAGKQNVCVWFCVCLRYWMDSIYNWMFLSSLTIILPSMTTFFQLVCCIKRLLLLFLFILYRNVFLSCFYHAVSCSIYVIFSGFTSFLSLLSIRFIPCLWFLFCVSVFLNPFLIFSPLLIIQNTHFYIHREYLPLRTKS